MNDQWWRRVAPSWFTGKIGDFAWLLFAHFLPALLLAWLLPRREKLVGAAAIVGVGLISGMYSGYYASRDGGLAWTPSLREFSENGCDRSPKEMISPQNSLVRFRLTSDARQIERSEDGGHTWQTEYAATEMSEAQRVYVVRNRGNGSAVFSSHFSRALAVMDATTGNLIVAAGHQGVMVRTPDGAWHAVGVGQYVPIDFRQPDMVLSLLAGKTLVALAVFALAAGTMAPGRSSRKARLLLVLGWLALCGIVGFKIMFLHDNVDHARNKSAALIVCVMSATLIFQRGPIGFTLPTIPSPPR